MIRKYSDDSGNVSASTTVEPHTEAANGDNSDKVKLTLKWKS